MKIQAIYKKSSTSYRIDIPVTSFENLYTVNKATLCDAWIIRPKSL